MPVSSVWAWAMLMRLFLLCRADIDIRLEMTVLETFNASFFKSNLSDALYGPNSLRNTSFQAGEESGPIPPLFILLKKPKIVILGENATMCVDGDCVSDPPISDSDPIPTPLPAVSPSNEAVVIGIVSAIGGVGVLFVGFLFFSIKRQAKSATEAPRKVIRKVILLRMELPKKAVM